MTQIHRGIILAVCLIGFATTLAGGVALAQSAVTASRHQPLRLTSDKIILPFGNEVFAGGEAAKLANSRCLLCHSRSMIDTQPPLTLETWKKEIDKMRTTYRCPIDADQTAGLAEFISQATSTPAIVGHNR
ncbi:MAG: cytochrome c [Candidatus Binataceae bacterium]